MNEQAYGCLSFQQRCFAGFLQNTAVCVPYFEIQVFFKISPPFSWPAARIDTEENASTRFKGVSEKGIRHRGRHFVQTSVIVYFYVYFGDIKSA